MLDDIDRRILEALGRNARMSVKELAAGVGLSSPSVSERLRRLEEKGVLHRLHHAAKGLEKAIESKLTASARSSSPLLVIQFDEASVFLQEQVDGGNWAPNPARYVALNRIISCLKTYKVWFFFLSTDSKIKMLVPPDIDAATGDPLTNSSAREPVERNVPDDRLHRFPPFIFFCADIEVRRALRDPLARANELRKSLAQVAQLAHLRNFGRPLWAGYELDKLLQFAQLKLLGGNILEYQAEHNTQHVLAVLSHRLALDVCAQNPRCMPLVEEAVGTYLRVVDGIDPSSGIMSTHAPSEPVLAQAAMQLLCAGNKWSESVQRLAQDFVQRGFIDKGLKGELFARLLAVAAQDALYKRACRAAATEDGSAPDARTASYTLCSFLACLYGNDFGTYAAVMDKKLLDTRINFTHVTVTEELLTPAVLPTLLRDLLRCRAALQLCSLQPYIDLLIPGYQGAEDEELDPDKCVYIGIQVKNREADSTTPDAVLQRSFQKVSRPAQPRQASFADDEAVLTAPEERVGSGEEEGKDKGKVCSVLTFPLPACRLRPHLTNVT